jgi:hypothetical protein
MKATTEMVRTDNLKALNLSHMLRQLESQLRQAREQSLTSVPSPLPPPPRATQASSFGLLLSFFPPRPTVIYHGEGVSPILTQRGR